MHPNPAFRQNTDQQNINFARSRAFGTLAINGDPSPLLAHVPFLLSEDGAYAELHLVRSNPVCRQAPTDAVLSVTGPDGYVSPDWYQISDQVPTWNYVAVHLRGRLEPLPQDALLSILDRLSAHFEDQLIPKLPWTTGKMTPEVLAKMMRMILPFRMQIETIDGTWKLNQNKDDKVRANAANAIETGIGSDLAVLAQLMREA